MQPCNKATQHSSYMRQLINMRAGEDWMDAGGMRPAAARISYSDAQRGSKFNSWGTRSFK